MKLIFKLVCFLTVSFYLTACSSLLNAEQQPKGITVASDEAGNKVGVMSGEQVSEGGPLGGSLEGSMDDNDKSKLSKALDGGLGKSTHWVNGSTGIAYTVIPLQKVTVGGNSFCRTYSVTAERNGNSNKMNGTACLASDGAWHKA